MKARQFTRVAAAVVALTLLAGACGSDERIAATGDCDTVDSVSLQLQWFTQAQFAGYYAAVDKGIYEKYCLDVTVLAGGVDIAPQQQLASGAVDFAVSWVPKALVVREQGANVVNVAQIFQRSGTLQVSWADSGINTPGDLAGKVVGNWGWGNEFELLAGARSVGLDPSTDFELVQQSFDMMALLSHEIDASQAMIYNEYAQVLEAVNPDTGARYVASDLSVINWNAFGTALLRRLVAGAREGWAHCRDNSSECVDIVLANGSTLGASHQAWQMNEINGLIWPSPDGVGRMDANLWNQTINVATSESILTSAPDAGAYTTKYVDAALASLNGRGMDTTGQNWQRIEVTLNLGGE